MNFIGYFQFLWLAAVSRYINLNRRYINLNINLNRLYVIGGAERIIALNFAATFFTTTFFNPDTVSEYVVQWVQGMYVRK